MATLYQLGAIQFQVAPVNVSEVSRETGSDFAAKDVMGAPRPREFVGEADERLTFAGTMFPQKFGGLSGIEALQSIARAGQPQMLMRGDGAVFGWYVIEKVTDKHSYLDVAGVGRMIEFEIELVKSPNAASAASMMSTLMSLFS
jgi:phage protein U